jgi:hypothetical protein
VADSTDGPGAGAARRIAAQQDRLALAQIVRNHGRCEATGERLDVTNAIAMTVAIEPGVSRLAVVSAAHWDSGNGPLSVADPNADPDVLDGRTLFPREDGDAGPARPERGQEPPRLRSGGARPVQRLLRPAPVRPGLAPRL